MDHVDRVIRQWGQQRPDLDVRPMELIARLRRISDHMAREMERTFADHGLTTAGFDVLATLRRAAPDDGLSPGDLIDQMLVTSGTMTHRINLLVKAGLVVRLPNPNDGRGAVVRLTAAGRSLIDRVLADHVLTQARLVASLDAASFRSLNELLRDYAATFEDELSDDRSTRQQD